jgi:hypothetical protein
MTDIVREGIVTPRLVNYGIQHSGAVFGMSHGLDQLALLPCPALTPTYQASSLL